MGDSKSEVFIGQGAITRRVNQLIDSSKMQKSILPHLLIVGPKNTGRMTLAIAIAKHLGVKMCCADAAALKSGRELLSHLTNLDPSCVLIIREIELISRSALSMLHSAIDQFRISVFLGEGVKQRELNLNLQQFTCISIASNLDKVPSEIKQHAVPLVFVPYTLDEALAILRKKCLQIGVDLGDNRKIKNDLLRQLVVSVNCSIDDAMALLRKAKSVAMGEITYETFDLIGHSLRVSAFDLSPEARNEKIQQMSGVEFEAYIADIFSSKGFAVEITSLTGDHGVDLRLFRTGRTGIVQCKRWTDTIPEAAIRDFCGAMSHEKVDFGYFVTSSEFSSKARTYAIGKNISLVDIKDLTYDPDWFV